MNNTNLFFNRSKLFLALSCKGVDLIIEPDIRSTFLISMKKPMNLFIMEVLESSNMKIACATLWRVNILAAYHSIIENSKVLVKIPAKFWKYKEIPAPLLRESWEPVLPAINFSSSSNYMFF